METIMDFLGDNVSKKIHEEVMAVGHRVVHGLDIHNAVLLDDNVIEKIKVAAHLAPLHNPPGLQGIEAAQKVFSGVPQASFFNCPYNSLIRDSQPAVTAAAHKVFSGIPLAVQPGSGPPGQQ